MSHGTSHHPQLLKYSLDFESWRVHEAMFTLFCICLWKICCQIGVIMNISKLNTT